MENDAISRSAVLEEINEMDISDCTDVDDIINKAYATIAYAPALDVAPKWISVKERLPEKEDNYLVRKVHSYSDNDGYSQIDVCIYCKMRDPEWIGCGNLCKVTHWMPLPEPPKEA